MEQEIAITSVLIGTALNYDVNKIRLTIADTNNNTFQQFWNTTRCKDKENFSISHVNTVTHTCNYYNHHNLTNNKSHPE